MKRLISILLAMTLALSATYAQQENSTAKEQEKSERQKEKEQNAPITFYSNTLYKYSKRVTFCQGIFTR